MDEEHRFPNMDDMKEAERTTPTCMYCSYLTWLENGRVRCGVTGVSKTNHHTACSLYLRWLDKGLIANG